MSKWAVQPMDSYDPAPYAVQVSCFVCDGSNPFDAELCRHCQAPLALTYQSESNKAPPRMVAVIGSRGAGKTVYLGMLTDILSRHHGALHILARGAFSVTLQQETLSALAGRRFPSSTPVEPGGWNWVHCDVYAAGKRRPIGLVLPDVSGEAYSSEINHPHSCRAARSLLIKCAGVMILVDTNRLERGDEEPDFFGMKVVSYLCELNGDWKKGWPNRPVAVVFTKADQGEACFDDPGAYAHRLTPGLWEQCRQRLNRHNFFAASVAGACARITLFGETICVPLRIEPRGVVEPFGWLVGQLASG